MARKTSRPFSNTDELVDKILSGTFDRSQLVPPVAADSDSDDIEEAEIIQSLTPAQPPRAQEAPFVQDGIRHRDQESLIDKIIGEGIADVVRDRSVIDADVVQAQPDKLLRNKFDELTPSNPVIPQIPFGPLRSLDARSLNSRRELMEQLNNSIPINLVDLPTYFYRPDMLDHAEIQETLLHITMLHTNAGKNFAGSAALAASQGTTTSTLQRSPPMPIEGIQDRLNAAIVSLSYDEGYPTTPNGMPFWSQLDFEPLDAFRAFQLYLDQTGARQISALSAFSMDELRENYHLYCWAYRAKAYDLYRTAHHQRLKMQRALETENQHYNASSKLFKRLEKQLEAMDIDELDPVQAVSIMEKLVKIQRVSAGLSANGGGDDDAGRKAPTTNVIVQQIANNSRGPMEAESDIVDTEEMLTNRPDMVDLAQELIIKSQLDPADKSRDHNKLSHNPNFDKDV